MASRGISALAWGLAALAAAAVAAGQTTRDTITICRGVAVPEGYVIVASVDRGRPPGCFDEANRGEWWPA